MAEEDLYTRGSSKRTRLARDGATHAGLTVLLGRLRVGVRAQEEVRHEMLQYEELLSDFFTVNALISRAWATAES
jgi:hypothetical protein